MLPFPELVLLEFIDNAFQRKKSGISFGEIYNAFANFGLGKSQVAELIETLRLPRDTAGYGFLLVDNKNEPLSAASPDKVRVELLPAAKFFLEYLSLSCEYTFRVALDTKVDKTFLDLSAVDYKATGENDDLRAYVSAQFIYNVVLPLVKKSEGQIDDHEKAKAIYRAMYPSKGAHLMRLVLSISHFVSNRTEYGLKAIKTLSIIEGALGR